ncbi:hypothetical protein NL676_023248 [Syzygium grande]|nr:hypothetical protein NL676_023248 [Syzygium grande]
MHDVTRSELYEWISPIGRDEIKNCRPSVPSPHPPRPGPTRSSCSPHDGDTCPVGLDPNYLNAPSNTKNSESSHVLLLSRPSRVGISVSLVDLSIT